MSTNEKPVYIPRSPAEHVLSEILALFFALILGIPASVGLFAVLFALTERDAGSGAMLGVQIGVLLVSLAALGYVARHLTWLHPIGKSCAKGALWLCVRPHTTVPRRTIILPPPARPQMIGMRIVPGTGLQYIRSDRDHDTSISVEMQQREFAQPPTVEHVIVRTPENADLCLIVEQGLMRGNWSRPELCTRRRLLSQPRWMRATDTLVDMGILQAGKTELAADLDSILIVESDDIQP